MNTTTASRITVRPAAERGHADHGWLRTAHSFSFADYYDPAHMRFRSLRVINDDYVAAQGGFPPHPHRDMEIFSYVLQGALAHEDSLGNGRTLRRGEVQLMSAGTGVVHSEFNPSSKEDVRLLQVWILPNARGLEPSYTEWKPTPEQERAPKVLVISPDGREGSAVIHQDADVYRLRLQPGETVTHVLAEGRGAWLQVAEGELSLNDTPLKQGDGASSEDPGELVFTAQTAVEALLFDLK